VKPSSVAMTPITLRYHGVSVDLLGAIQTLKFVRYSSEKMGPNPSRI
jgi:hypothetical protein